MPASDATLPSSHSGSAPALWPWPLVVFLAGAALTAALTWFAWAGARARDAGRFENAVYQIRSAIETRMEIYTGMLRAGAGMFAGSEEVTAVEFASFAARLDLPSRYPGVQGIGFAERVRNENRDVFIRNARAMHPDLANFEITPAGVRDEYFPILFLQPQDRRNATAIGYDMFSDPVRHAAMARARDQGTAAASGIVMLVQEIDADKQRGFLIYVPVYRHQIVPRTVEERRETLHGFIYSPFRAGDLLNAIFTGGPAPRLHFSVHDGIEVNDSTLLYRSANTPARRPTFQRTIQLMVADRVWSIHLRPTPVFEEGSHGGWVKWISVAGLLVSALLGGITFALARAAARERVQAVALFAQGERLRVTLSSIGDAVISTDARGRVVFMNPVAEQLTGWRLNEAQNRPLQEIFAIVDENTGAPLPNPVDRVFQVGGVVGLANHTALISREGRHILIDDSAAPIRSADGALLGVVLVFHDVTDQRRGEEALRASEARKDAILQSALDAIVTIDRESRIVDFNPAGERIFGRTRGATLGMALDQLMPASVRDQHHRGIVGYLETGHGPSLRQQFLSSGLRADGTEFPAELAIVPIPGSDPPLFTAFVRDITERQQAEQELRAAAERFRFLAESMPVKIFTAKADGAVDYFNEQWIQFTGLSLEEISGRAALTLVHPEDLDETVKRWEHAVRTGEYFEVEHRFRDRHGAYVWHLSRAHALRDSANHVVIWIGSSTDIDSQKRAEERLERTVEQRTAALRDTNEQLESFVYTIAHDLRAPLRAVAGYSQLLSQDHAAALDTSAQHLLKRIQASAEFMDRLILDLIAFGRTSRAHMELTRVDVNRVWSIALAQHAGEVRERRAKIETVGPLPHVRAHEATLGQVLANLLSNALKFVPAAENPIVRFWAEDRGNTVRLWLADNGIGIPAQHQERIFRVFERLNGSNYSGTGIGLSIVRKGVERMGGTVGLESAPGQGSRFWIEMPKA